MLKVNLTLYVYIYIYYFMITFHKNIYVYNDVTLSGEKCSMQLTYSRSGNCWSDDIVHMATLFTWRHCSLHARCLIVC